MRRSQRAAATRIAVSVQSSEPTTMLPAWMVLMTRASRIDDRYGTT
jgi:hypothetical protein